MAANPIPEAVSVTLHSDRAGCEWFIVTSKDHTDSESEVTPSDDPALFDLLKALTAAQQQGQAVAWPTEAKHIGSGDWEARTAVCAHTMSEAQARVWNACLAACKAAYTAPQPTQQGGGETYWANGAQWPNIAPPSAPVGVGVMDEETALDAFDRACMNNKRVSWHGYTRDDRLQVMRRFLTALAQQPAAGAVDWRAEYRIQTAMRYMDNNPAIDAETAYRWADREIRDLATQHQEPKP
jgi:hypothetical protein